GGEPVAAAPYFEGRVEQRLLRRAGDNRCDLLLGCRFPLVHAAFVAGLPGLVRKPSGAAHMKKIENNPIHSSQVVEIARLRILRKFD
ncbi:hypothetical protein, partial [Bradyrhizobium sp. YR681]|uniref:hypothetical protein n=1 Tax=Bradyrhizobium sp. YR681 TaxID=1144344 RepID=UPI001AEC680F